jgi:hypothetical protein
VYRYFPPIFSIRYGRPETNRDDYIITGNKLLKRKEFMNQFILDNKMYENMGVFEVSEIFYPSTYYTLGMGCTQYVNGIFNFMTNNHYSVFIIINKGDTVMLELDTKEKEALLLY